MARSSAAQEPSMEEILASIRKIIESGDDRPEGAEAAVTSGTADPLRDRPEDAESQGEHETGLAAVAAATDAGQPDVPVLDEAPKETGVASGTEAFLDADFTDLKLELEQEFSAGFSEPLVIAPPILRAASVGPQFQPAQRSEQIERAAGEWPLRSDGRHAAIRAAAAVAGDREAARPAVAPEPLENFQPAAETEPTISGATHRPANSDDPRMRDFREAILRDSERAPAPLAEPLISSRSGDLVSASFEELDRAIREGQLRSMEEMAEEMMRPLLQEWLDDNLPRIVERLVREEIERVARGGR